MKDCQVYFRKSCTCMKEGCCSENNGLCEFSTEKEECISCKNKNEHILKCYECKN